jgi:hypothetical protein
MKTLIGAALAAAALAAQPALAQTPAPAPAPAAQPAAKAGAMSVETTPIEQIAATEQGKAILDKHLPGMTSHEAYGMFKAMTLSQVQPMSEGAISTITSRPSRPISTS